MTKRLSILRHAKSDWGTSDTHDHDRILTQRGSDNAAKLGLLMQEQRILPDQIISSDATRAAETARLVSKGLNYSGKIELRRELYLASAATLLNATTACHDSIKHLMLVAHNPGMTEFVNQLSNIKLDNLPTCGIFCIDFEVAAWSEISGTLPGQVHWYHYPKLKR
ncbi:MAG: hypothetical protein HOH24_05730 [Chromatiales bacterium]|jgi:phosphohistidine phosphatase|nr:hypothetical protein [Chromatiales bacterium]